MNLYSINVLSVADGDAGAEGREEGPVWLYAHQLTALNSARVHLRTLPPVVTPRHTENNPALKPLLTHSDLHLNLFTQQALYFLFLSSHCWVTLWFEIMHHEACCCFALFGTTFIPLMFLHCETHVCKITLFPSSQDLSSHPSPLKHKIFFVLFSIWLYNVDTVECICKFTCRMCCMRLMFTTIIHIEL